MIYSDTDVTGTATSDEEVPVTGLLLGVDNRMVPALDDKDAYAAMQIAFRILLGQISQDEVFFPDCATDDTHPKSTRLRQAVPRLLELAATFADSTEHTISQTIPASSSACCRCPKYGRHR